jgi:hypothetical protein
MATEPALCESLMSLAKTTSIRSALLDLPIEVKKALLA